MTFLTPLDVRKVGERWTLLSPLRYALSPGRVIEVPAGFYTDFASIPRLFYLTTPPTGRYDMAAVVHDYLYYAQMTTRAQADRVFLDAMRDSRVGWYTRTKMYWAVRAFGGRAWRRYAQDKADAA